MDRYTLGQKPVEFSTQILIADNQYNLIPLDLTAYLRLFIEFRKPNGKVFTKTAVPVNPSALTNTSIKYLNNEESGSILDMLDEWSYTGIMEKNGTFIKGAVKEIFHVSP